MDINGMPHRPLDFSQKDLKSSYHHLPFHVQSSFMDINGTQKILPKI